MNARNVQPYRLCRVLPLVARSESAQILATRRVQRLPFATRQQSSWDCATHLHQLVLCWLMRLDCRLRMYCPSSSAARAVRHLRAGSRCNSSRTAYIVLKLTEAHAVSRCAFVCYTLILCWVAAERRLFAPPAVCLHDNLAESCMRVPCQGQCSTQTRCQALIHEGGIRKPHASNLYVAYASMIKNLPRRTRAQAIYSWTASSTLRNWPERLDCAQELVCCCVPFLKQRATGCRYQLAIAGDKGALVYVLVIGWYVRVIRVHTPVLA